MRQMCPENLTKQHPREDDVVSELRLARALGPCVDLAKGLTDYIQRSPIVINVVRHLLPVNLSGS
jgi:hypothetical protein